MPSDKDNEEALAMMEESRRLAFESLKLAEEERANAERCRLAIEHNRRVAQSMYGWSTPKPTQTMLIADRGMPLKATGTPAAVNQQPPKPLRWWERWERELYKILGVHDGSGKADRGSGGSVGQEAHAREQDERNGKSGLA